MDQATDQATDQAPEQAAEPAAGPAAAHRLSASRWRLLREVLRHREAGRTVDELADVMDVSRNAVQQHVTALERDGLVRVLEYRTTGGRPSRSYTLTEAGLEVFPRNYARLADALLRHAQRLFGDQGLDRLLDAMAAEMADDVLPRLAGTHGPARTAAVVRVLDDLGYDARLDDQGQITAVNCVYHEVARNSRAACRFDARLMRRLLEGEVTHLRCMADGHAACVFATAAPSGPSRDDGNSTGSPAPRDPAIDAA